jgi:nitrous oxidase accessory protein NosD
METNDIVAGVYKRQASVSSISVQYSAGLMIMAFNVKRVEDHPSATITVPDRCCTIQEAINAANPGDTTFARNGTNHENIVVNKTVKLIGENNQSKRTPTTE